MRLNKRIALMLAIVMTIAALPAPISASAMPLASGSHVRWIDRIAQLPDYAKEMRVTRVSENLLHELDENTERIKEVERDFGGKRLMISVAQNMVSVVGDGAPLLLILYKVMITGTVGLGGFAVAMNGIWTMSWLIGDLINRIMKYHEHGIFVEKIRHFMECEPQIQSGEQSVPPMESMTLRGLTFSYPGKESVHALEDVNLDIRRGEKIAIVGYNGAGKTTLTKLLMRLYDPDSGEILYNGKNIREYKLDELRGRVAAVFQDYRIFAASLAENVAGVGSSSLCPGCACVGIEVSGSHVRAVAEGDTVTAFARLLHKGTTLHVWNVDITNTAGELISNVRVTNYVIKSKK